MQNPFISGDPEEIREKLIEHQQLHAMHHADFQNNIRSLMRDIPADNLLTLRHLLKSMACDASLRQAAFLEGMAVTTLEMKHDVCSDCGRNHEKENLDMDCTLITDTEMPHE